MEAITMKRITEAELAKELRKQYIKNPPEGMTSDEVRDMSDDDLLDMDYFLHEFDNLDDVKLYATHPEHVAAGKILAETKESRACVDYEF